MTPKAAWTSRSSRVSFAGGRAHKPARERPAAHKPDDIGEGVPADRDGTDLDQDGIDRRKGNRKKHLSPG